MSRSAPTLSANHNTYNICNHDATAGSGSDQEQGMLVEDLSKFTSSLARSKRGEGTSDSDANHMVQLSKRVMDFIDLSYEIASASEDSDSNAAPCSQSHVINVDQFDRLVADGLWDVYRIPSVVNRFPNDTFAFYEWWRSWILRWISCTGSSIPKSKDSRGQFQSLGWKHLAMMVLETRKYLIPPPKSYRVSGAGARVVNGLYELSPQCLVMNKERDADSSPHYRFRFYGPKPPTYENTTTKLHSNYDMGMEGKGTVSLCCCNATNGQPKKIWFLTQLDDEQPGTDCDTDYYYAPYPSVGGLPPTGDDWKSCNPRTGLFPPPKVQVDSNEFSCSKSFHYQLAKWIIDNDFVTIGLYTSVEQVSKTILDEGISSCIHFLMELYDEDRADTMSPCFSVSLGSEFFIRFATWCIFQQHGETSQSRTIPGRPRRPLV